MAKRYLQMLSLIEQVKPRIIVEVGVHGALRAKLLCTKALEYGPVHYIGYDVFETLGEAFQEQALNGKGMATEAKARERLNGIAAGHPGFSYELVIGDTRDTLHNRGVKADFAFIDGDHRVDAIAGDYAALETSYVVCLDDYYRTDPLGNCPDLQAYGANATVAHAASSGKRVEILPVGDQCKHGGLSHLAVVR